MLPRAGRVGQISRQKAVCPLGKPYCVGVKCKYFDPRTKKCKLLAKMANECITC